MQLSDEDREQLYRDACPMCAKGVKVRLRGDTHEWVHDQVINKFTGGVRQGHSLCYANWLRKKYG